MVADLVKCCNERLSLGELEIKQLCDRLNSLSESEKSSVYYHSECRKPLVNKVNIERLRTKRSRCESPASSLRGPGRPSCSSDTPRPKRTKNVPKSQICVFSPCGFCPKDNTEPLHRVASDRVGKTLIDIKQNTVNDQVRTCVSELVDIGDASALEKWYHRACLRSAQRTTNAADYSDTQLIRSICDEELLISIQNTLTGDDVTLSMAEVNEEYVSLLKWHQVCLTESANYKKHLKNLITERLPYVQFVKSVRKNEPESIVLPTAVSKAMEIRSSMLDNDDKISQLRSTANMLRNEMMGHRDWSFNGSFEDFKNPPLLQFFLTHLLFGRHVHKVSEMRNEEVDKMVDVSCQFMIQNSRTDRQVKHQPKKDDVFLQTLQTPLSIGLPLAIHSRVRDRNLVNNLSDVYIGSDYRKIVDIEKRVEQAVLRRMVETGGYCLPDFVKKGVNIWFAVDNIDLLEDTPTGQNTFHGTVIVINQRNVDGEPVNQPLVIPEKLQPEARLAFEVKYLPELEVTKAKPIRFDGYQLGKRQQLVSKDYTHAWALATFLATPEDINTSTDDANMQTVEQQEQFEGQDSQNLDTPETQSSDSQDTQSPDKSIISVTVKADDSKKLAKQDVMPTWAATRSLLLSNTHASINRTNSEVIAPLFKTSPTDITTLYTVLMLTQGISAVVVGPERKTIITLDLDLYSRALQIQQTVGNTNWILRAGVLHIVFAALHALGKTVDGSGIDTCAIESGIYTSAALRGIYGGKAYKRGMEYHITTSLAIMMMLLDASAKDPLPESIRTQCESLRKTLHERNPDTNIIFENIQSWYSTNIQPHEKESTGEQAQFLLQYIEQVDSLLCLIGACRSGDWEGYLAALENIIKYFFAHDLLNYARLMPIHLAQMNALENDDPVTWEALKSGDFVVAKSDVPFTRLFTDQTLEQEIKMLKRHGGIVGLSQDDSALDRLVTTTPHLSRIVRQYLNSFPQTSTSYERSEHYQLSGGISVRTRENAIKLRHSIEMHCKGSPFALPSPLKSLVSSALVPHDAKDDILHFAEKGQKRFQDFIHERLLSTSTVSVWDPMKKLKLKTFSNWAEKIKVRTGDKVIKLREERELFGRFLIIQGSRPELVPKLEDAIGEFEMSVVPRSLCAVDGSLYIPTDKASLMHVIEAAKAEPHVSDLSLDTAAGDFRDRALVVDAMAVLQSMKKTPTMRTLADLRETFVRRIENMLHGFNEGRIIFDRYLDQSLKNKTRQKRAVTSTEFEIHPEMKLSMSLKELLSSSKTKSSLTAYLAQGLLEHFQNSATCSLIVAYDTKIKGRELEEVHTHEEADTLIPHQVLASAAEHPCREICVSSPDTDVFILLIDLVSRGLLAPQTHLKFVTGKGRKYREIDVIQRVHVIGHRKCQGLIGLHNFSGADWGGKFVGISKKTWADAYMALDEDDPAIECFQNLGTALIPTQLIHGELPPQLEGLERFVCRVYCTSGPSILPALRWEMFRSRNLEGESLPPTRATILPHITRANYIAMRDKSYTSSCPVLPPIEENGWLVEGTVYKPVKCLEEPAPKAVIELTKCGCKSGCVGSRCKCYSNKLPCTPLCKCYATECANVIKEDVREGDIEDEDDE